MVKLKAPAPSNTLKYLNQTQSQERTGIIIPCMYV